MFKCCIFLFTPMLSMEWNREIVPILLLQLRNLCTWKKSSYRRSIAAHQSLECTSLRTKVSLHASQWAPGVLFPEVAKCAERGTTRELQQGLTARFDRTESGKLRSEMRGPPRFAPPVCFPTRLHTSYMSSCAWPAGNWSVGYNKKGDWGLLSLGLWFINLHSLTFWTDFVWGCDAHSGE